jgi:starch-binding outer membrane protein, SusD/RagB family
MKIQTMKNFLILSLAASVVCLILTTTGCSDFLNKVPQGNLTQNDFPTTSDEALLAVNASYDELRDWYFSSGGYPILDIMSDDARKGSNPGDQASTVGPYDYFGITPTQDGLDRWWAALYEGIKRCNVVIEKVPLISMDETLRSRYIAEAQFLRAWFYFDLVRAWGGVPLVTTTEPPLKLTRSTKEDVYNLVVSDLQAAIPNLPDRSSLAAVDFGRATSGAAEGLLAKVYLFENDFQDAEKYAQMVINSGEYALDPSFSHTFSVDGEYNSESLLEVGALPQDDANAGGNQFANTQGVRGNPNRGWGFNRPSLDLMATYEPGDPRKDATIIYLGEVLDGVTIIGDGGTPDTTYDSNHNIIEIECYNQKVWTPGINTATQQGYHRRLLRYADVLLIASEAANENGDPTTALQYLNMVRARARGGNNSILPDITVTDQSSLRDIIIHERRVEMALEADRFWTLVRTGQAVQVLGPLGFTANKNELLPIPQSEIDLGQGAINQNSGY